MPKKKKNQDKKTHAFFYIMEYKPKLIPVAPVLLQKSSRLNFSFGHWGSWNEDCYNKLLDPRVPWT